MRLRLKHMLIITAVVVPTILYFNFHPNFIATVLIGAGFAIGFVALHVWHLRDLLDWLRARGGPSARASWGQPPPDKAEPADDLTALRTHYWGQGKDQSSR